MQRPAQTALTPFRAGRPEAAAAIWQWRHPAGDLAAPSPSRARLRGCLQAVAGAAVGLLVFWLSGSRVVAGIVLGIAGALALAALLSPTRAYAAIERTLERLGAAVGRAMAALLLPVLFFTIFVPFGLLFRRGRRDAMRRFFESDSPSYWSSRERGRSGSGSRTRQF